MVLKVLLRLLKLLGMIIPVVTDDEKKGRMSPILHRIPNACADLALFSFRGLKRINEHRRTITALYVQHAEKHRWPVLRDAVATLPLQKFPLFVENAREMRRKLKEERIFLDDGWTGCVICPESTDQNAVEYHSGSDPNAEAIGRQILTLPIHPTMTMFDAERLARRLTTILKES